MKQHVEEVGEEGALSPRQRPAWVGQLGAGSTASQPALSSWSVESNQ